MTSKIRKILYPLSILFEGLTKVRNKLYDDEILGSKEFDLPIVLVGNLRVGGTGKTPQVAYLVKLLKEKYRIAVLSRGYKRKTSGFVLANSNSDVSEIGDEAYQLSKQFSNITIAVDADRVNGINKLVALKNPPEVIVLDDAFQHRKIRAGFNILLTPYADLYTDDSHLPTGNLRENTKGAERAQVIIVTKCPDQLTEEQEFKTAVKLHPTLEQTIFFTKISYADFIQNEQERINLSDLVAYSVLLITGIDNPLPLLEFLDSKRIKYKHLSYKDHHHFTESDIEKIEMEFKKFSNKKRLILSTEKDYVRIFGCLNMLYYLAIETTFINHQKDFDTLILNYVEENTRDRKIS